MTVSTAIEIRRRNKERIRSAMQKHEKCTKANIARETELSMATCSTALNEMMEEGEVLKVDQTGFNIGRPADLFTYNRDFIHIMTLCTAVQNGEDMLEYAIADALGNILKREAMPVRNIDYQLLEELVTACRLEDPLIRAVGLGIPGHAYNGYIEECDIASLNNLDFAGKLRQKHEDIEIIVENDMNFVAYCLYMQHEEQDSSFAVMYFPTEKNSYVGCGYIANGRLLKGDSMMAGELSHVAKAFGISYEDQAALLQDRKRFRCFAAKMVALTACTINPKRMTLMGNNMCEEDLAEIRKICAKSIPEHAIPQLDADNNMFDDYIEGLIRFVLDSMLFPILT